MKLVIAEKPSVAMSIAKALNVGGRHDGYIESGGRNNGISTIALSSGSEQIEAHCFYENRGYHKYGFGFKKEISL